MARTLTIPQAGSPVNISHLSDALRPTYDLICALSKQTGYCYARASWLAAKLGVSESQLSRRLKQLRDFGLLVIEHLPGLRRLLRPACKTNADSPSTIKPTRREPQTVSDPSASLPESAPVVVFGEPLEAQTELSSEPLTRIPASPAKKPLHESVIPENGSMVHHRSPELPDSLLCDALRQEGVPVAVSRKLCTGVNVARLAGLLATYRRLRQEGKVRGVGWLVQAVAENWQVGEVREAEKARVITIQREPPPAMETLRPDMQAFAHKMQGLTQGGIET